MCGRFILKGSWAAIHQMYNLIHPEDTHRNVPPRYNIAPTQEILYVADVNGERRLLSGRWWLVPHWAKDLQNEYPMFNARSEEAHKKPAFREAFKYGRCLIPADGYYEWTKSPKDGKKDPHLLHLPDFEAFAFAGLSAFNETLGLFSCTILTAPAVKEIKHIHHRMPVILKPEVYDTWLDRSNGVDDARAVLNEHRDHELISYQVDRAVGNSRASGEKLIEPAEEPPSLFSL
ncbi:Putative SOS response-associated peptidase YedK [Cohaesibacter sp. ES.047]|uniref:SOS response-associated peptidase n=1 Tax=Cohaesibacter sp. ES.047 TaxID=1798205 RepID=UPI000BB79418|nr:SOS response-associated peptidase [Cohaesibacter sp. ES.047]SNY92002.1 Putative SOS response-associated peptidase YedK [Cohaesibacter sp. ES.047]